MRDVSGGGDQPNRLQRVNELMRHERCGRIVAAAAAAAAVVAVCAGC